MDVESLDMVATKWSDKPGIAVAAVNKKAAETQEIELDFECNGAKVVLYTINGESTDSYNDVDRNEVSIRSAELGEFKKGMKVVLEPHSVNVIQILPA